MLTQLCDGLAMSRQAVTKRLGVFEAANLVVAQRPGREKLHFINPVPIGEIAARWIGKFERNRVDALVDLRRSLEAQGDRHEP